MTGYSMTHQPPPFEITDRAACKGSDVMYGVERGSRRDGLDWEPARRICASCPVKDACLAHAIAHNEKEGMWGGLTPDERERPLLRSCVQCGKDFTIGRTFGAKPKLCSDECRRIRWKNKPKPKQPKPAIPCVVCGEDFHPVRSTDKTCSPSCRRQHNTNMNRARRAERRAAA